MAELTVNVVVEGALGVHARVAAAVVGEARRFGARIRIRLGDREADAKSIVGLLTLGAARGAELTVSAEGADAAAAVRRVADVLGSAGGRDGRACAASARFAVPLETDAALSASGWST